MLNFITKLQLAPKAGKVVGTQMPDAHSPTPVGRGSVPEPVATVVDEGKWGARLAVTGDTKYRNQKNWPEWKQMGNVLWTHASTEDSSAPLAGCPLCCGVSVFTQMLPFGGSTVIFNRDLRAENGLFISVISFLDGGLSQCFFFFFPRYANSILKESSHCGIFQSNGYQNDSMNYFLSLSNWKEYTFRAKDK